MGLCPTSLYLNPFFLELNPPSAELPWAVQRGMAAHAENRNFDSTGSIALIDAHRAMSRK
jgi:hypothetical protein